MKKSSFIFTVLLLSITHSSFATQTTRNQVVTRYLADLQNADYKDITSLFEPNGVVVSTSRGKINAKEFFYGFLPNIQSAKVDTHQLFAGTERRAARFHLQYTMKDGEKGAGEYMDEFVFSKNSAKLAAVYMFENSHFDGAESTTPTTFK